MDRAAELVTAPTDLTDPESKAAGMLFEACARAEVPALKDVGVLNHGVYRAYDLLEGRIQ